jgi:hypothetical protein
MYKDEGWLIYKMCQIDLQLEMRPSRRAQKRCSPYGSPKNKIWLKKTSRSYYSRYRPASTLPAQLVTSKDKMRKVKQVAQGLVYTPMWKTWNGVKPEVLLKKALLVAGQKPKRVWSQKYLASKKPRSPSTQRDKTPQQPETPTDRREPPSPTIPSTEVRFVRELDEKEAEEEQTPQGDKTTVAKRQLFTTPQQEVVDMEPNQGIQEDLEEEKSPQPLAVTPPGSPRGSFDHLLDSPVSPNSPGASVRSFNTDDLLNSPESVRSSRSQTPELSFMERLERIERSHLMAKLIQDMREELGPCPISR